MCVSTFSLIITKDCTYSHSSLNHCTLHYITHGKLHRGKKSMKISLRVKRGMCVMDRHIDKEVLGVSYPYLYIYICISWSVPACMHKICMYGMVLRTTYQEQQQNTTFNINALAPFCHSNHKLTFS